MRKTHLRVFAVAIAKTLLLVPVYTSRVAGLGDDKSAKYIIEMERKWAFLSHDDLQPRLADRLPGGSRGPGRKRVTI